MAALDTKVETFGIATTKETTIQGTKHGGFRFNKMLANTIQNGTPSPATPFPLLSTGDCVDMINGVYNTATGVFENNSDYICNKNNIPCKAGDVVAFSLNIASAIAIYYYNGNGFLSSNAIASISTSFTVPSGATHFRFATGKNISKITITINGKYLGCAKTNKEIPTVKGYWNPTDGVFVSSASQIACADFQECRPNSKIEIAWDNTSTIVMIYFDKNMNVLSSNNYSGGTELEVYAPSNAYYFKFYCGSTILPTKFFVSVDGNGETIAWFLTQYPMIKGSTLFRENGLVKVIHTTIEAEFNGSENIQLYALGVQNVERFYITVDTPYAIGGFCLCSHFPYMGGNEDEPHFRWGSSAGVYNQLYLFVPKTIASTVAELKTWLASNPIKAQWQKATPIIETLDTESQIALNGVETFDGVTHVAFDTRVQPLEFEAEVGTSQVGAYTLKALNNSESSLVNDADNKARIEDAISTMLLIGA